MGEDHPGSAPQLFYHTILHFALDMRTTKSNHFTRDDPIKIPIFNSLEEEKIEMKKSKNNSVPFFPFF